MRITRSGIFAFAVAAAGCRGDTTENISTGASDTALRAAGVDDREPRGGWVTSSEISNAGDALRGPVIEARDSAALRSDARHRSSGASTRMARQRTGATRGTSSATSGGTRGQSVSGAGAGAHASYPESDTGLDAGVDGDLPDEPDR